MAQSDLEKGTLWQGFKPSDKAWPWHQHMLFVLVLLLALMLADWLAAVVAVQHCASWSKADDLSVSVAVLSDIHVDSLCPFADLWMSRIRELATNRWQASEVLVLGDTFSTVGGEEGSSNVSDASYSLHVARARAIMGCDDLHCIFIPGNHDVQTGKYQQRYVDAFGWPGKFGQIGNLSYYQYNSMDPFMLPSPSMRADLLLMHVPNEDGQSANQSQVIASVIASVRPKLVLAGHTHVAARDTIMYDGVGIPQVTLPSLNFVRSVTSGDGNMGLGWLQKHRDGRLHLEFCRPINRGAILVCLATLTVVAGVVLACVWWLADVPAGARRARVYRLQLLLFEYAGWMLVHLIVCYCGLFVARPRLALGLWLTALLALQLRYQHWNHSADSTHCNSYSLASITTNSPRHAADVMASTDEEIVPMRHERVEIIRCIRRHQSFFHE